MILLRLLRHLLAIAALPFVVTVVIPRWIAAREGFSLSVEAVARNRPVLLGGIALMLLGLTLFVTSLWRFGNDGKGTLAPWDPPRRLVVVGPYRFVRNPMISGVVLILCAEAFLFTSVALAEWALTFFVINAIYIPLFEEAQLRARFGDAYAEYCANVPRLVPRTRPWSPIGAQH